MFKYRFELTVNGHNFGIISLLKIGQNGFSDEIRTNISNFDNIISSISWNPNPKIVSIIWFLDLAMSAYKCEENLYFIEIIDEHEAFVIFI